MLTESLGPGFRFRDWEISVEGPPRYSPKIRCPAVDPRDACVLSLDHQVITRDWAGQLVPWTSGPLLGHHTYLTDTLLKTCNF